MARIDEATYRELVRVAEKAGAGSDAFAAALTAAGLDEVEVAKARAYDSEEAWTVGQHVVGALLAAGVEDVDVKWGW